jgi:hypothetical protein
LVTTVINRLTSIVLLACLAVGLSGCGSRPIPAESESIVETFAGSSLLSAVELECLGSRKELATALIENQNNNEGFQKALFDTGDVAMAQQVLDCFGERWSRIVRVRAETEAIADCSARVYLETLQSAIDGGSSDLRVAETATATYQRVYDVCQK